MKNTKKKGFTLVELVIVIAVIAILAAVLIPTFASVINRANQSAALQEWKAVVDTAYIDYVADFHKVPEAVKVTGKNLEFVEKSYTTQVNEVTKTYYTEGAYVFTTSNQVVVLDDTNNIFLISVDGSYQVVVGTKTGTTPVYKYGSTTLEKLTAKGANVEVE